MNLIGSWSASTGYSRLSQMETLVRGLIFFHLSVITLHQTLSSAVHTFTAKGASCLESLGVQFEFVCTFTCLLDALRPHRGQGPHLTLICSCFYIWSLITIDHTVDPTCYISVIVNVLIWHSGDFSNEAKLLDHSSIPWHNCRPPYFISCCSIWFIQSTVAKTVVLNRYASVTVWPPGNHLCIPPHVLGKFSLSQTAWNRKNQCQPSFSHWNASQ